MPKTSLKNKTVLITGASSGIGAATARAFAEAGSKLILSARREDKLAQLKSELENNFNSEVDIYALDVQDLSSVKDFYKKVSEKTEDIDILVNNAGLASGTEKLQEANIEDWEAMIDTNVKGLLYISRLFVPWMIKRKSGHVFNIGSIAGREAYPGGSVYCATKHAVRAISRALKMDVLDSNIRVTNIEPGAVETEFSVIRFKGDKDKADKVYEGMSPLTAEDIADCIIFSAKAPAHVNISEMLVLANQQASAYHIHRN